MLFRAGHRMRMGESHRQNQREIQHQQKSRNDMSVAFFHWSATMYTFLAQASRSLTCTWLTMPARTANGQSVRDRQKYAGQYDVRITLVPNTVRSRCLNDSNTFERFHEATQLANVFVSRAK